MSVWNAIWSAGITAVPSSGNPQAGLAAPVGTLAVDGCGNVYVKRGGGTTAYGWYLFGSAPEQSIDRRGSNHDYQFPSQ
jgi:hypothetical protein